MSKTLHSVNNHLKEFETLSTFQYEKYLIAQSHFKDLQPIIIPFKYREQSSEIFIYTIPNHLIILNNPHYSLALPHVHSTHPLSLNCFIFCVYPFEFLSQNMPLYNLYRNMRSVLWQEKINQGAVREQIFLTLLDSNYLETSKSKKMGNNINTELLIVDNAYFCLFSSFSTTQMNQLPLPAFSNIDSINSYAVRFIISALNNIWLHKMNEPILQQRDQYQFSLLPRIHTCPINKKKE